MPSGVKLATQAMPNFSLLNKISIYQNFSFIKRKNSNLTLNIKIINPMWTIHFLIDDHHFNTSIYGITDWNVHACGQRIDRLYFYRLNFFKLHLALIYEKHT